MRNHKEPDRFFVYVIISLIVHLLIFTFVPFGNLIDVASSKGKGNQDFGFVQYVEFRTTPDVAQKETKPEETVTEESRETEDEKKENKVEKKVEKTEKKAEKNVEVREETTTKETSQETESVTEESVNNKTEEQTPTEKTLVKEEKTSQETDNEIITGEESDLEIEVKEEKKVQPESKKQTTAKKTEEKPTEKTTEETEPEPEPDPAPPPPPAAGELVGIPRDIYYPKDLINEEKTGTVGLTVTVSDSGEITNVEISNSSGIDKMDNYAVNVAQRGFNINPYKNGYTVSVTFNYIIDDKGNPDVEIILGDVSFK